MLSNSRFEERLMVMGILPEGGRAMLHLLVRDPGGNLEQGFLRPQLPSKSPLTRMVAAATAGPPGVDVDGYRDYRGVPVVGAWTWLDKYGFGLAVEVDRAEAFRALMILKRTFWGLLALLALSSLAIFVFTVRVAKLKRQARAAAIEAKQLGQYQLEQKLGAGAMGVVYRGRHAMLRRPTAIKLLDADKVTEQSISRFEREVQITSQLTHPNTVQIFDFGRTPEGVFYYAMEYLEGIDLQALVDKYGPQPAGRVIHILRQVCGSLYEAHSSGLVHRDIKPSNLMLTRRGAEADVVKVLDFGLVKLREDQPQDGGERGLAGTPLYMSPEAIQLPNSVDGCSDLYAVGAVGYFLLTGRPVFEAGSIVDLCNKHVSETPVPPSQRLGRPVPEELENAILACLEKSRAKRPQTARDLAQRLARCPAAAEWTIDDAEDWWSRHERGLQPGSPAGSSSPTLSRQYEATIDH
jgi:serine/threonine protein kinase